MHELVFRSTLPASAESAFTWHERPGAFERLNPPWKPVRLTNRSGGIQDGSQVTIAVPLPFVPSSIYSLPWTLQHQNYIAGKQFQDVQVRGPFASWKHTHSFIANDQEACTLEDKIEFSFPLDATLGRLAAPLIKKQLEALFRYRHTITQYDLSRHAQFENQKRMRVLVSGSSGLVGSALVPFLTCGGHSVAALSRNASQNARHPIDGVSTIPWNPESQDSLATGLECDAVIHLAGENIAAKRWSSAFKRRIRDSRVEGTHNLCRALAKLPSPPKVLVCASAVGFYGDGGDNELSEENPSGKGFLADTCVEWEEASAPAVEAGIRVVHLRIGMVLDPRGGALMKMLPPFLMGLGGRLGSGRQFVSWIALDDLLAVIYCALMDDSMHGPYNAVSPQPVRNAQFTKSLGKVLKRPTIFPAPAPLLRIALGEFADKALLASTRAIPKRLLDSGFTFQWPQLVDALKHCLGL